MTKPNTLNVDRVAPDWGRHALCSSPAYRDRVDDLWFATPGQTAALIEATRLCTTKCPVRQQCLHEVMRVEGNLGAEQRQGVQGGLTGEQRHTLYKELRKRGVLTAAA